MSNSKSSPRKKRLPSLAIVARPIRHDVQAALLNQKPKIFIIDPETNDYAEGLLNKPILFLTFSPPSEPSSLTKKRVGFVPGTPVVDKKTKTLNIDAKLYFTYPDDSVPSGYDKGTGITVVVIEPWHRDEIKKWRKIAQKVASELVVRKGNIRVPIVFFYITSYILPHDPNAPHCLTMNLRETDGDKNINAVSHHYLQRRSVYFDDK